MANVNILTMKSKQAQELLDKNSTWFADNEKTQSLWVRNYIAEKAIELAEEEMREKAIEAHINSCIYHLPENKACKAIMGGKIDGCYYSCEEIRSCHPGLCKANIEKFIEELNK